MSPVRIKRGREPVNFVRREPRMVAGTPTPMLHQTICQSSRRDCQYFPEATSVPGMVAGSGEATAINPGYPRRLRSGVAIALPPLPNNPPRKPITIPTTNASRCCKFHLFVGSNRPIGSLADETEKAHAKPNPCERRQPICRCVKSRKTPDANRKPALLDFQASCRNLIAFIRVWRNDRRYSAAKTRSALPGVPAPNTYPEPTNSMPPATVGPAAAIEPPLALT